jgi:transcriptional regulator with XRE-family HTH domain
MSQDLRDPSAGHPSTDPRPARKEPLWGQLVGEQLRDIRHARGETLFEVAHRAGVSPQYLSEIERGHKEPSSEILAAIGGSLDTPLLDLTIAVARRLHETTPATRAISLGGVSLAA